MLNYNGSEGKAIDEKEVKQLVEMRMGTDGQDMEAGKVAMKSRICPPACSLGVLNG